MTTQEINERYNELMETTARELVKIAKDYVGAGDRLCDHFTSPEWLKQHYPYMSDVELQIFAHDTNQVANSVSEYLIPRIRGAETFQSRIVLGELFGSWRVWRMIIQVPGLSMDEIRRIMDKLKDPDVVPWPSEQ